MNEWVSPAFVLRIGHFREIDLWLKLLVPSMGIVTAFAFGGAKSKRRFCGCLDVLNTLEGHFRASKRGDAYTLEEATLLAAPSRLRRDWSRMGIAANCIRFLECIRVPQENASEIFLFMEDFRSCLERDALAASLFPLFFRFSLACRLGYAPDFLRCGVCSTPLDRTPCLFLQHEGISVCSSCRKTVSSPAKFQVILPVSVRMILQSVRFAMPRAWSDASLFSVEKRLCSHVVDGFIQYHLGLVWEKGTFRKV